MSPAELPESVDSLKKMVIDLVLQIQSKDREISKLNHRLEKLLQKRDLSTIDPNQLVFDLLQSEQEDSVTSQVEEEKGERKKKAKINKKGHGRKALPDHLERKRVEIPVERWCECCKMERPRIGEEVTEKLEYEPAHFYVVQYVRAKLGECKCQEGVTIPDLPPQVIDKGIPGPGLLAYVLTSKYADHLPLHRLESILERSEIEVSRSTMCDWVARGAELVEPLVLEMTREVLLSKKVHTDDTPVKVQDDEEGTYKGRIWVYLGDKDHPFNVFDYTPTRRRDGPAKFLKSYKGFLQADAYAGYDAIYASKKVHEVACWAHAKRKFDEVVAEDLVYATLAKAFIKQLYEIEREGKSLDSDSRRKLRQEQSKPLLESFRKWLEATHERSLPKSNLAKATKYCLLQWRALIRYVEDGDLAIDNNAAERALRGIAIGRRNWLFFGSDEGGRRAAILYSIISTCKRNRVDPFRYLRDVLDRVSTHPVSRIRELLPDEWKKRQREKPPVDAGKPVEVAPGNVV